MANANNPKITPLPSGPNEAPAQMVVWPDAPNATTGIPVPSVVPGQTDAPNPKAPNVAKRK